MSPHRTEILRLLYWAPPVFFHRTLMANTPAEITFNKCHKSTRVRVETVLRLLKKFALINFGLRKQMEQCSKAMLTARILHNQSKWFKNQIPKYNFDTEHPQDIFLFDESDSDCLAAAENVLNKIA